MKNKFVINRLATLLAMESADTENHLKAMRGQAKYAGELRQEIQRLYQQVSDSRHQQAYAEDCFRQERLSLRDEIACIHEKYTQVCERAVLLLQSSEANAMMARADLVLALREAGYEPYPVFAAFKAEVEAEVARMQEDSEA